ncbi:MAG: response regulator transcription factor [Bacteroidetes bacterium]|nr:response regulator transcription factor [Bacteroidota bacterium]
MERIKVIITDDNVQYRKLFKELLKPFAIDLIGEASNGQDLLTLLETLSPDVILLDIEMPGMDGIVSYKFIKEKYPMAKVVMVSSIDAYELIQELKERGVKGFVHKHMLDDEILWTTIKTVKDGGVLYTEISSSNK